MHLTPALFVSASRPQPTVAPQDEYLISPITGEKIQASKMQEHMRIGLLDPRWLEQRDRSIRDRQTEDEVFAPGLDIESSLKQLAERRTDIFGVEETAIGKKIGEEEIQKPEEKVSAAAEFAGLRFVFALQRQVVRCITAMGAPVNPLCIKLSFIPY